MVDGIHIIFQNSSIIDTELTKYIHLGESPETNLLVIIKEQYNLAITSIIIAHFNLVCMCIYYAISYISLIVCIIVFVLLLFVFYNYYWAPR